MEEEEIEAGEKDEDFNDDPNSLVPINHVKLNDYDSSFNALISDNG